MSTAEQDNRAEHPQDLVVDRPEGGVGRSGGGG